MCKIKNNLKKYRMWKGLTRKDLSEILGLSEVGIQYIEYHQGKPNEGTIQKILDFFGVSYSQMFYTEED